jgi:hypothetical protein
VICHMAAPGSVGEWTVASRRGHRVTGRSRRSAPFAPARDAGVRRAEGARDARAAGTGCRGVPAHAHSATGARRGSERCCVTPDGEGGDRRWRSASDALPGRGRGSLATSSDEMDLSSACPPGPTVTFDMREKDDLVSEGQHATCAHASLTACATLPGGVIRSHRSGAGAEVGHESVVQQCTRLLGGRPRVGAAPGGGVRRQLPACRAARTRVAARARRVFRPPPAACLGA